MKKTGGRKSRDTLPLITCYKIIIHKFLCRKCDFQWKLRCFLICFENVIYQLHAAEVCVPLSRALIAERRAALTAVQTAEAEVGQRVADQQAAARALDAAISELEDRQLTPEQRQAASKKLTKMTRQLAQLREEDKAACQEMDRFVEREQDNKTLANVLLFSYGHILLFGVHGKPGSCNPYCHSLSLSVRP